MVKFIINSINKISQKSKAIEYSSNMQEFPSKVTKFDLQSEPHTRSLNYGGEDILFELFLPCYVLCFSHNFCFHCEVTLFTQQKISYASDICIIPLLACRSHVAMGPQTKRVTNCRCIYPIHEIIIATSHSTAFLHIVPLPQYQVI